MGDYLEITFDGEPMDIQKHETLVTNIPAKTGKTDGLTYCTGILQSTSMGKVSFKYRNIENPYGSACIMLDDDAYVQDGYFHFETGDGTVRTLDYAVAEQKYDFTNYKHVNTVMCIKKMGFDEMEPLIMLPTETGNGASVFRYYGDVWMYTDTADGTPN